MRKVHILAMIALLMASVPLMADDYTLCPTAATPGGYGGQTFQNVTATSGTCGTAVQMNIPNSVDEAKLMWSSPSYPSSLTFGNFGGATALVSNYVGNDEPYFILAFQSPSQAAATALGVSLSDQIIMLEFQSSTLTGGGTTMALDPSTTLFNLYDNEGAGFYLQGPDGQHNDHPLDYWLSLFPGLASDQLAGLRIGMGLSGGCGQNCTEEDLTINDVDLTETPEPSSLLLLGTGLGALAAFYRKTRQRTAC